MNLRRSIGACAVAGRACAALAACFLAAAPAVSQDARDGEPVSIGTFRVLHSNVLNEDRTLLVCLPEDYLESAASYPVLFVLYADQIRNYFAEAVRVVDQLSSEGRMPKTIVVGVANVDRYRDLSPVEQRGTPSGIEPFSRFVVEELLPSVAKEYRTKDYRLLVGPQAGAEFGLYTLGKRPGVFDAFFIENPFRFEFLYEPLAAATKDVVEKGLPSRTFLHVAAADRAGRADKSAEMEHMRRFERTISEKRPPNLTLVARYVEGNEDFLPPLMLKEGLRDLFVEYRFPADRPVAALADVTGYYAALSGKLGFEIDVPEAVLAAKADDLVANGDRAAAREMLEYLIASNPVSLDGWWRLANLHREAGDRARAIECYRRCLEIMPAMGPARQWIEKLEKG
jgi:uncharacterized protein